MLIPFLLATAAAPWRGDTWHCAVLDSLTAEDVNALQTESQTVAGGGTFESATLTALDYAGLDLTDSLRADGTVMLAFEATQPAQPYAGPELVVSLDGVEVYRYTLPTSVTSVDAMYRYLNLRGAESNSSFVPTIPGSPPNLPDAETDGKHFVFVHGYNVNATQSRDWARAIFKRLWWSGSQSKFTAVDWHGDESQAYVPTQGDVSPNYYINVKNAFMTAGALSSVLASLPGQKIMLAHSLGNMLVSSAAKDHDLQYAKYYMLNAAVPMEAYDENAYNDLMVDGAWEDLDEGFRAAHFSELFAERLTDFRSELSWKGRFAGIRNAVNCYSLTEDVLKNPSVVKVFGVTVGEDFGGAWSKQELFKGCALWYGVNAATFSGTEIEGGWGINAAYTANPLAYIPLVGFDASHFANYSREDKITSPLFTAFNDSRMHATNALCIVDEELRAKMLGDAIPAESFAAGRNVTGGVEGNYNYQGDGATPNGWPDGCKSDMPDGSRQNIWAHSDIKKIAYWYVYKLYRYFLQ